MPLPDPLEIVPLARPVEAEVSMPGSKSITNRALVLAALGASPATLRGALWSEDTEAMMACLARLGIACRTEADPREPGNRTLRVQGGGGRMQRGGTPGEPLDLYVANAGTAARFLAAFVCLGKGVYRLHGSPRMHERPQAELFAALRQLGYRVDTPNERLPALIHGTGPRAASCSVSLRESSQFASALLLAAAVGGWQVQVQGENAEEAPYVAMTRELVAAFAARPGEFRIEPDASSGSYFWAANWLAEGSRIRVADWPASGWQIDASFPGCLPLPAELSRQKHLGDSIMTAIVLAPFAARPVRFCDLGRLRLQECERVRALRTELTRCGAQVREEGDALTVSPSALQGAEIETYQDHRMAMCFATLGLKVPGIRLKNPACVKKTFPSFYQKLAAPPPHGLGAAIRDVRTGRALPLEDLLAT
jgi:3-phosphoshikimate 1-carboxyvinyltransferase